MRRNIPNSFSQDSTFIHFMPTFLWGRICYGQDYPGGSVVKNLPAIQEPQETMFSPWFGKIPWRTWQPTPVFLPGEFHGQSIRVGCIELNTTNTHTCYGQNWDLRHGASVCMSCVPTCNVCMLVCVCKNVFIWIVIGLVLNINFELIVHLIYIYIMFLLISPFIFQKILREKMVKFLKTCHSQTAHTWLISWAFEIPMLLIYAPLLVLFFSYVSTFPSLIFKLQILIFFSSHFFCSI